MSAVITPLFLVAGTFFPLDTLPSGPSSSGSSTRSTTASSSSATRSSAASWVDALRAGFLIAFALVLWRIAIHAMERKLID